MSDIYVQNKDINSGVLSEKRKISRFPQGLRGREVSEVFGRSRIPNNTGSRSRTFLSDSDSGCPIGPFFLNHTPKLGIPVEMVQFLLKLSLKQNSCCAQRFPLILTVKFHSLDVKESESEILSPTPKPWGFRQPRCLQSARSCRKQATSTEHFSELSI